MILAMALHTNLTRTSEIEYWQDSGYDVEYMTKELWKRVKNYRDS